MLSVAIVVAVVSALALFSDRLQGADIIATHGLGLAVFLSFGLFTELLLAQLGILIYLLRQRLDKNGFFRIPAASMMYLIVSVSSAAVFYLTRGSADREGTFSINDLSSALVYFLTCYAVNELVFFFYRRLITRLPRASLFFKRELFWAFVACILTMPLGIAFYAMYASFGDAGLIISGVQMVALSFVLQRIGNSRELIGFLQKVNRLGQKLTEEMSVDNVLNLFFRKVPGMIPTDYLYYVSFKEPEHPKLIRLYQKSGEGSFVPFQPEADIGMTVYRRARPVVLSQEIDRYPYLDTLSEGRVRAVLSVPMMYHGEVVGVVTAATHTDGAYIKSTRIGMEIVADFFAVALENAKKYEKRKNESERDPLTNLYNYRYLIRTLTQLFTQPVKDTFSLILLDIDDFKKVNDTYGHENGNAVLIGMADRLRRIVGDSGIIARYGGEEITVVLPGADRSQSYEVAESIRKTVASEPFMIYREKERRYEKIAITVSIGVATAPDDAKTPTEFIYYADHAMYAGAKRKGKNRVSRLI